ncbi:uncharacterized protein TRAVEDRAFT_115700 [Trametes versicolor FP-101664 SS1]|uniref:uncharacterized protein n=1 Tax=Trametes versicolor (strain FP-101664) TaxID=717944 RepID=UPI0004622B59|nr:uncharacterized protein TRAVEDRAFT_115700 [Trametes versicolor FP-101664 SS1]EIW61658.1 hypothetical protein TRAVEDRAFT_115700 [Trametes versicolor FP-101664 SS1]
MNPERREQHSSAKASSSLGRPPPRFPDTLFPEQVSQYAREYWKWLDEDSKIPPHPATPVDRKQLIRQCEDHRVQLESLARQNAGDIEGKKRWYTTMVGFPKHSSSTPLQALTRIDFSKMYVRKAHAGRFLLCRVIAPCVRMVAVQVVVEDPEGIAYPLSIYNFPTAFGSPLHYLDTIFPRGTVLAIREPILKPPSQDASAHPFLRVDSPADIAFVPAKSPLLQGIRWRSGDVIPGASRLPNALGDWQLWGNEHYRTGQWFPAALTISHALTFTTERDREREALALRLNRAEAYLRLQYYSGAAYDAQWIITKIGTNDEYSFKALLRLAKARYGRGDFRGAAEDFLRWKNRHPEDAAVTGWLDKCRQRMHEAKTGQYDWVSLFLTASVSKQIRVEAADFVGPLEVRWTQDRGRGMIATRNIKTGDLLLAAKPFASVYGEELPVDEGVVTIDLLLGSSRERTDALLLARIVEKIYGNPDLHDAVFDLHAGPNLEWTPPHTYPPPHRPACEVDPFDPQVNINISRLEAICTYNVFCPVRLDNPREDERAKPAALYTLPSMFNHCCVANATWYCIGDLLIVRAAEPIPAGTEVTIPYCVEETYPDRRAILRKHMIKDCRCRLCLEDQRDGDARHQKQRKLKEKLDNAVSISLAEMRTLEEQIAATYGPGRSGLRPLSARALHVVAEKLRMSTNPHDLVEAIRLDMKALERYGFALARGGLLPIGTERIPTATSFLEPIEVMLRIANTYVVLRDEANAASWLKAALWLTDMSVGGGRDLFMLLHQDLLRRMGIYDFAIKALPRQ